VNIYGHIHHSVRVSGFWLSNSTMRTMSRRARVNILNRVGILRMEHAKPSAHLYQLAIRKHCRCEGFRGHRDLIGLEEVAPRRIHRGFRQFDVDLCGIGIARRFFRGHNGRRTPEGLGSNAWKGEANRSSITEILFSKIASSDIWASRLFILAQTDGPRRNVDARLEGPNSQTRQVLP
jgi:hypothetical protein